MVEHGYAGLVDSPAPPVRRVEEIVPVSVRRLDARSADRRPRAEHQRLAAADRTSGPAGTTITLTHGEWLGPDGDVTTDHLTARRAVPAATAAGGAGRLSSSRPGFPGDVFEPRHTTHGFQYVRIEGHPAT